MPGRPTYEELEQRIRELEKSNQENFSRVFINLLENATDFLYFKDKKHRFTAVSQVFASLTGHKHWRDIIGKCDQDVFSRKDAEIYYKAELSVMNEGTPLLNWREPYQTPEGGKGWVNTNKWPIKDENGNVIGLFGISRDITELVKTEETLKKSEEKFRQLFEHSSLGIAIHDMVYDNNNQPEDYILRGVNPAYCKILNLDAASVRDQRGSKVYGLDPAPLLQEYATTVTTQRSIDFEFFFESITKWFKIKAYSHQPDSFVTVFEDITESKNAEKDREKIILELKKALAEVKTLSDLLPICSYCKNIRDDKGYWKKIEVYLHEHTDAKFTHSICQKCAKKHYPDWDIYDD